MSELATTAGDDWASALAEPREAATDGTDDWNAALGEQRAATSASPTTPASLPQFQPAGTPGKTGELDSILDIPITLSVEIGKSKLSIRHLLQLNQGSVVELERIAGEPMDVLVNGMLVAHGEVVVVNDKLGVRLTDVVSAQERVRKLK